jgi:hypothetical protein
VHVLVFEFLVLFSSDGVEMIHVVMSEIPFFYERMLRRDLAAML